MNHTPQDRAVSILSAEPNDSTSGLADSALIEAARSDHLRPVMHFVSPAGWLNDPNGVGWRDGVYHLFYQYNPLGAFHHSIHWGHAVSRDLLHWEDRPIALTPGDGADEDGCWSGVLVDAPQGPALVYSGRVGEHELPCVAFGSADLTSWEPQRQPIIDAPPAEYQVTAFRDHCVWFEDGTWRQLVGSGIQGRGGCAFLYESEDFVHWQDRGPMVVGHAGDTDLDNTEWTGTMWECVDFFAMKPGAEGLTTAPDGGSGHPHVLIFSAWHEHQTLHSMAAVGTYDGRTFTPDRFQRLDLGGRHAYAPQTFIDGEGRRILWAWMQEGRDEASQMAAGWSGAMTLPRRLWLTQDLLLCAEPVPELRALRERELPVHVEEQPEQVLATGTALDMELDLSIPNESAISLDVFASAPETATTAGAGRDSDPGTDPDSRPEFTRITLERETADRLTLSVDRSASSLNPQCADTAHSGSVPHREGTDLHVRVVLDQSSLEIFTEGVSLTTRVYPTRPDAEHVVLRRKGPASVETAHAWTLRPTEQSHRQMYPQSSH